MVSTRTARITRIPRLMAALLVSASVIGAAAPPVQSLGNSVDNTIGTALSTDPLAPNDLGGLPLVALDPGVDFSVPTGPAPAASRPSGQFAVALTNSESYGMNLTLERYFVGVEPTGGELRGEWLVVDPGTCGFTPNLANSTEFQGLLPPGATCAFVVQAKVAEFEVEGRHTFDMVITEGFSTTVRDTLRIPFAADALANLFVAADAGRPTLVPGSTTLNERQLTWYNDTDVNGPAAPPDLTAALPPLLSQVRTTTCDPQAPPQPDADGVQECTYDLLQAPSVVTTATPPDQTLQFFNNQFLPINWRVPPGVAYGALQPVPGGRQGGWDRIAIDTNTPTGAFGTVEIPIRVTSPMDSIDRLDFEIVGPDASEFNASGGCGVGGADRVFVCLSGNEPEPRAELRVLATPVGGGQPAVTTIELARWSGTNTAWNKTAGSPSPSDGLRWTTGRGTNPGDCSDPVFNPDATYCAWFEWTPNFTGPVNGPSWSWLYPGPFDSNPAQREDYFQRPPKVLEDGTFILDGYRATVTAGTRYLVAVFGTGDFVFTGMDRSPRPRLATDITRARELVDNQADQVDTFNAPPQPSLGLSNPVWTKFTATSAARIDITAGKTDLQTFRYSFECDPGSQLRLFRLVDAAQPPSAANLAPVTLGPVAPGSLACGSFLPVAGATYYLAVDAPDWDGLVFFRQSTSSPPPPVPPTITITDDPVVVQTPVGSQTATFDPNSNASAATSTGTPTSVSCLPVGPYGIGDRTITCSASDGGATATERYVLRVQGDPERPTVSSTPATADGSINLSIITGDTGNAAPLTCSVSATFGSTTISPTACPLDAGGRSRPTLTGVPFGTPGTVTVRVTNAIGRVAEGTVDVAPLVPVGATNIESATSTAPTGTASATSTSPSSTSAPSATTSVVATGQGSVTVAQYPQGVPASASATPFASSTTTPFDVVVSNDNTFSDVVIRSSPAEPGGFLWWFDEAAVGGPRWKPAWPTTYVGPAPGIRQFIARRANHPSPTSPTIEQLRGTIFAVADAPPSATFTPETATTTTNAPIDLSVRVSGGSGSPISGASVTLQPGGQTATAGADGTATFRVTAAAAGAVTYTVDVDGVPVAGSATVTFNAPPPPPPPPTGTSTLQVSTSRDRAASTALDGATVSGPVSIFLPDTRTGSRVASVTFRLDGTVIRTERFAPFDFGSTAVNGTARPWNSATVANGPHVITAEVRLRDGTVRTETATFQVLNPRLLVSTSPDRRAATPLDGATVSGPIAVFLPDTGGIRTVEFFLDGTRVRTERYAAYDLNSTAANGTARLLDVLPGIHTVRAVITYRSGLTDDVTATFERTG